MRCIHEIISFLLCFLDGRPLPYNIHQKTFPNGTLIVENTSPLSSQGRYTCTARNKNEKVSKSLFVTVLGKFLKVNRDEEEDRKELYLKRNFLISFFFFFIITSKTFYPAF